MKPITVDYKPITAKIITDNLKGYYNSHQNGWTPYGNSLQINFIFIADVMEAEIITKIDDKFQQKIVMNRRENRYIFYIEDIYFISFHFQCFEFNYQ